MANVRRRKFIALLGGAAAWPLAARAQQREPPVVRRIGVLMNLTLEDSESRARRAAFERALHVLGWTVGDKVLVDYRWAGDDADNLRRYAIELVALAPDVILANGTPSVRRLDKRRVLRLLYSSEWQTRSAQALLRA
jgi:putative ABC transport system substrate-binding protein